MNDPDRQILDDYCKLPMFVREYIETSGNIHDDLRSSSHMTKRETILHLTEANIVAAAMVIAALGSNSASFDWSWLWPNRDWVERMRFAELSVETALEALTGNVTHISALIAIRDDAFDRCVKVMDTPDAEKYALTIRQILVNEVEHARVHIAELRAMRP